jgi:3-oxoacyl-[acyl-carrier-protein] synthase II
MTEKKDVWITGIGLLSSLGEGVEAHWQAFAGDGQPAPVVDHAAYAPYPVHPLGEVEFSKQITKKGDLRQMEPWQRIGTYAAGLALEDAGLAGNLEVLDTMDMIVAAGSGERDTAMDQKVLEAAVGDKAGKGASNEILKSELRPTLFLAQLSNLLAGNISIVHKVTGSSRTYMGEELAGLASIDNAFRRIAAGQSKLMLVGGANNAERKDSLLIFELGQNLWGDSFRPVFERLQAGGGLVQGSVGAFLVLEEAEHARARGAKVYAKLSAVCSDRCRRDEGQVKANLDRQFASLGSSVRGGSLGVLSGAAGTRQSTAEELDFINGLAAKGVDTVVRAYGSLLGHSFEAQMPAGLALAAMALANKGLPKPFDSSGIEQEISAAPQQILLTSVGHWRGEGLALVEAMNS